MSDIHDLTTILYPSVSDVLLSLLVLILILVTIFWYKKALSFIKKYKTNFSLWLNTQTNRELINKSISQLQKILKYIDISKINNTSEIEILSSQVSVIIRKLHDNLEKTILLYSTNSEIQNKYSPRLIKNRKVLDQLVELSYYDKEKQANQLKDVINSVINMLKKWK